MHASLGDHSHLLGMCSTPRKSWDVQRMKFSPSIKKMLCFPEYICSLSLCKKIQAGWNYRPYHQVKVSQWSKQEGEIFVQRNIFRFYSAKNNLSFRVTGEQVLRSLVMHQNSFKIKHEFQDSTYWKTSQNPSKNSPTHLSMHKKILSKILRVILRCAESAHCQRPHKAPLKCSNHQKFLLHFGQAGMTVVGRPTYFHSYLPNKTWTTETICFLSILKYSSKSSFRNLRGRN